MVRLVLSVFTHMKDHSANKEWKRSYFTQIKELYDMDKDMVVSMLTNNAVYWIHPNIECSADKIHALKLLYYKIFGIGVSNLDFFQSYFHFKEDEWRTYAETGEKTEEHYKLFVDTHNKLYTFLKEAKDKFVKYFGNDTMFGPPNRDYIDIEEESITWIWEGDSDSECSCDCCNELETSDEED
jgi:hypothetical protein